MYKIRNLEGFLGRRLGTFKNGLPLTKNVLKPLTKSVSILLKLTAASTTDAVIQKKMFRSDITTSVISNKEINNIMKLVQSHEYAGLLIKGVSEAIKNEAKEHITGFLGMLLDTLDTSLLGNMLAGRGAITTRADKRTIRSGEGTIRAVQDF